jgi:DNA-binding beta-propeller fold protein YncE
MISNRCKVGRSALNRPKLAMLLLSVATHNLPAADIATVSYRVVQEMGHEQADQLSLPTDVVVASNGDMYVVDSGNNRVVVFSSSGRRIGQFGEEGSAAGQLQDPVGIGIAPDNSVYIADRGNSRIVHFSADGSYLSSLPLQEDNQDVVPIDVAIAAYGGEIFVTTNNSHRILVFSSSGELLRGWGEEGAEPGQFRYPATLALADGMLYVVDVLNARIQIFDVNGGAAKSFGDLGAGPGTFFRPKGVAIGPAGRVYVSDSYLGVVQVFSPEGEFLHAIGNDGVPTRFENPVGLASFDGRIVLIQMLPHTILILEPELEN